MMVLWLLLCAFVSLGLSDEELLYGDRFSIMLLSRTQTLKHRHVYGSTPKIVWHRDGPTATDRHSVKGSYFEIASVTQKDSGLYRQDDKNMRVLSSTTLDVQPHWRHEVQNPGAHISLGFDLESHSCNIYFIPKREQHEYEIVLQGELIDRYDDVCPEFEKNLGCRITNDNLEMSCNGYFEIRDEFNNKAFVMELEMESLTPDFDVSTLGVVIGVFFILFGCCCYLKHCCCKKSSSKKNQEEPESPDSAPATNFPTYNREPAAPGRDQPSGTSYPALPSYNPSRPLIHNPPVSVPPAYSEVSAPADVEADAPILPVPAEDPGPRFELSFESAPPLSSDSNLSHVYTSDKLNFR